MNPYEELEGRIAAEIEKGIKEGFRLEPFHIRNDTGHDTVGCCAIGMVVRDLPFATILNINDPPGSFANTDTAASRLGITFDDALEIEYGFDSGTNPFNNAYRAVGVNLHNRFNQITVRE